MFHVIWLTRKYKLVVWICIMLKRKLCRQKYLVRKLVHTNIHALSSLLLITVHELRICKLLSSCRWLWVRYRSLFVYYHAHHQTGLDIHQIGPVWTPDLCLNGTTRWSSGSSFIGACFQCPRSAASGSGGTGRAHMKLNISCTWSKTTPLDSAIPTSHLISTRSFLILMSGLISSKLQEQSRRYAFGSDAPCVCSTYL